MDRTERRVEVVTPHLRWMHLAQALKEAYNDFKRDINNPSCQMTLFYYKFKEYEIHQDHNQTAHHYARVGEKNKHRLNY